jgi:hypothetical protein
MIGRCRTANDDRAEAPMIRPIGLALKAHALRLGCNVLERCIGRRLVW